MGKLTGVPSVTGPGPLPHPPCPEVEKRKRFHLQRPGYAGLLLGIRISTPPLLEETYLCFIEAGTYRPQRHGQHPTSSKSVDLEVVREGPLSTSTQGNLQGDKLERSRVLK